MPEEKDYLPVYREPASYARENDELSPYRVSRRENIACKEAIEESIRKYFDGMHLDPAAVKEVLEAFGRSRTIFVLAVTVNEKDYDGRFSRSNKEWATSFNIPEDRDGRRVSIFRGTGIPSAWIGGRTILSTAIPRLWTDSSTKPGGSLHGSRPCWQSSRRTPPPSKKLRRIIRRSRSRKSGKRISTIAEKERKTPGFP